MRSCRCCSASICSTTLAFASSLFSSFASIAMFAMRRRKRSSSAIFCSSTHSWYTAIFSSTPRASPKSSCGTVRLASIKSHSLCNFAPIISAVRWMACTMSAGRSPVGRNSAFSNSSSSLLRAASKF